MFGFVNCVSNISKLLNVPECLMYNILVIALELIPVEAVVLPVWFVPDVMDDETIAGIQRCNNYILLSYSHILATTSAKTLVFNNLRNFLMSWDMKSMVFNLRNRYIMSPV